MNSNGFCTSCCYCCRCCSSGCCCPNSAVPIVVGDCLVESSFGNNAPERTFLPGHMELAHFLSDLCSARAYSTGPDSLHFRTSLGCLLHCCTCLCVPVVDPWWHSDLYYPAIGELAAAVGTYHYHLQFVLFGEHI